MCDSEAGKFGGKGSLRQACPEFIEGLRANGVDAILKAILVALYMA